MTQFVMLTANFLISLNLLVYVCNQFAPNGSVDTWFLQFLKLFVILFTGTIDLIFEKNML